MLIDPQVVCSKSEVMNETQQMAVANTVVYRAVYRKAWKVIDREHQGVRVIIII